MTDDEAFIRAIVAQPGNESPRLVYADWLDERDDPRGAYVREELELAPADEWGAMKALRLAALARGLDPVWMARVSRPPAGVCCGPVTFTDCGPPLAPADVPHLEQQLGHELSSEHRALLLNYNGGVPSPNRYSNPESHRRQWDRVEWFLTHFPTPPGRPPSEPYRVDIVAAARMLYSGPHSPSDRRDFVPLAVNEFPYTLLVGVSGVRAGRVYWHNYYTLNRTDRPRKLADTVGTFLASFQPLANSE